MPTQTYTRSPTNSTPRAMTGKSPSKIPLAYPAPYKTTVSPVYRGSSAATSTVPSLISDAGSASSCRSPSGGTSDIDLLDLLDVKLSHSVKSEPLDRALARQTQQSGQLNAKQRELAELQALAQRRLKGARANFADGAKAAKEVKRDLEWTQKRVNTLKTKTAAKYPKEYQRAHQRYPSPEH